MRGLRSTTAVQCALLLGAQAAVAQSPATLPSHLSFTAPPRRWAQPVLSSVLLTREYRDVVRLNGLLGLAIPRVAWPARVLGRELPAIDS